MQINQWRGINVWRPLSEDMDQHTSNDCAFQREAELYALVKGAAAALGLQGLLADLGSQISCKVRADSSAAIGIAFRSGLGKLRHLNVQYLWIQEKLAREQLQVEKVLGSLSPADL